MGFVGRDGWREVLEQDTEIAAGARGRHVALLAELEEDFAPEAWQELNCEGKFSFLLHPRQRKPMCKACGWEGASSRTDVVRKASQRRWEGPEPCSSWFERIREGSQVVTRFLWAPPTLALFPSKSVAV